MPLHCGFLNVGPAKRLLLPLLQRSLEELFEVF